MNQHSFFNRTPVTNSKKRKLCELINSSILPELTKEEVIFSSTERGQEILNRLVEYSNLDNEVETAKIAFLEKIKKMLPTVSSAAEELNTESVLFTGIKIRRRLIYVLFGLLFAVGLATIGYFIWMKIEENNRDLMTAKNSQLVDYQCNIIQEQNKQNELAEKEKKVRLAQEQEILTKKAEELNIKNAKSIKKYEDAMARLEVEKAAAELALIEQKKKYELEVLRKKAEDLAFSSSETEKKVGDVKALLKIEKTSLFGQWRQETRSYIETITFNQDGTYVSVLEYTRGPSADTSAEFSGSWKIDGDELVQTRNGNTLKASIRMSSPTSFEEPSEDLNWPRIWNKVVPQEIKSDTSTEDQGRVVESFVATITNKDIRNSNGVQILDPVLILMQDRANVHRFGNPDGDNVDQFFSLAENRAKIRSFLERGSFPQDIQQSILSSNRVKLRIRVYSNDEGKNCVDVSYEGSQGDATSDFSPDQKTMAFIDSESNFRMEPSVNSAVKFQPRKGTTGLVLERRDKWVKIELENGDIGWAHESNLGKAVKSQDLAEPGIEQTKRKLQ